MGIKISQLPTVSASPLGLGLRDIQPNAAMVLVQSLSTQQVPMSAVGGAVFVDSLSALTLRAYNYDGNTKNTIGLGAIDLQYKGSVGSQIPSGNFAVTVGGKNNTASGDYSLCVGGFSNIASNSGSCIFGGANHNTTGIYAFIGGGFQCTASGEYSTVFGSGNTASGNRSVVGGGVSNQAKSEYSSVGGGTGNICDGPAATIGGGASNTIVVGEYSAIAGGAGNTLSGNFSFAVGNSNTDNNLDNVHILGSNISASQANFTYVNNISSQGIITGTLSAATYVATITSSSNTNYVLRLTDASRTIIDTAATTTTYSVPANSVTSFAIGTQIIFIQGNKNASNHTRLSAGVGVTLNSYMSSLSLAGNNAAGTLIKTGTDTWYLIGNLA